MDVAVPLRPLDRQHDEEFSPVPATDGHDLLGHAMVNGPKWKRDLLALMEAPASSSAAFLIHIISTVLITFSALITVLETLPIFHATSINVWFGIETGIVVLFTAEYLARCLAWSTHRASFFKWFLSFFGIIDLLGILPYYLELALRADTTAFFRFSILRTFRLLRVFRPFRHSNAILLTIEVMYLSFMRSKEALLALGFFVFMALIVFSTLLYFAERGVWDETLETFINADGDPSQFESIPAAAWFVLVTMTTVGYGDLTPRSLLGRLITVPLLLFGLLLIALPSFVLGREFSAIWESMHAQKDRPVPELHLPSLRQGHAEETVLPPTTGVSEVPADVETLGRRIDNLQRLVEQQNEMLNLLARELSSRNKNGTIGIDAR